MTTNNTSSAPLEIEAANPQTPRERLRELAENPALAPLVAANQRADTELLRELGDRQDPATQAAVAANPNAPLETLLRLAGSYPEQFCANPMLPLFMLEHPGLPASIPVATLQRILWYPQAPAFLLEWIAEHGSPEVADEAKWHVNVAGEIAADSETIMRLAIWKMPIASYNDLLLELLDLGAVPVWMLEALIGNGDKDVRRAVARSSGTPREALKLFWRLGASADLTMYAPPDPTLDGDMLEWLAAGGVYACTLAARHPNASDAVLRRMANHRTARVRQAVAQHPRAPESTLERLAGDDEPGVRQAAARNARTPVRALLRLAQDPAADVRWTVARNLNTPPGTLALLAQDRRRIVRQGAARNPQTPIAALAGLTQDAEWRVRLALATNPASAPFTAQLAADAEWRVQRALAQRPYLPADLRAAILAQPCPAHRHETAAPAARPEQRTDARANGRLAQAADRETPAAILIQLAEDDDPKVRAAVARNTGTPASTLAWLADDDVWAIHRAVAENPNTPPQILEQLARDYTWTNYKVRLAVIRHPQVTARAVERMASDSAIDIRRAVLQHPLASEPLRRQILAHSLDMCAQSSESFYLVLMLAHPLTPAATLVGAVRSTKWLERYAIASNPRAPDHALNILAQDANSLVRAAARATLCNRTIAQEHL